MGIVSVEREGASGAFELADGGLGFLHHGHRVVAVSRGRVDRLAQHDGRGAFRVVLAQILALPVTGEVEGDEHGGSVDRLSDARAHLDACTGGRAHPDVIAFTDVAVVGHRRIDLHEGELLQLGQPRVGAGFVAAAFILDQPPGGKDERKFLDDVDVLVLHCLVESRQAPEGLFVVVSRILDHHVGPHREQGLAVLRNRVGEVPHHGAGAGIAEGVAAMVFHHHADDAARLIGLPVLAVGQLFLGVGEFVPPAEFFQQSGVELGIAGLDVRALRGRTVRRQQRLAVAFDAEVGAEVAAAFHDIERGVVQIRRARMAQLRSAVAGPGQTEVFAVELVAGFLVDAASGAQSLDVEHVHIAHVRLQPLRALSGVANGPDPTVDLAQDGLGFRLHHAALARHHLVVLHQLLAEAELVGELGHDHVIGARLEHRLDHLLAPLQRTVGRCHRTRGLELRGSRQQVHGALGVERGVIRRHGGHGGSGRWIGIDHDQ